MGRRKGHTAASIEDLLKKALKDLGPKKRLSAEDMEGAWRNAAGAAAAKHSRPESIRRAALIVNVDNSGWLYELTIKKKDIIKILAGELGQKKIRDIRFRIGEIK